MFGSAVKFPASVICFDMAAEKTLDIGINIVYSRVYLYHLTIPFHGQSLIILDSLFRPMFGNVRLSFLQHFS